MIVWNEHVGICLLNKQTNKQISSIPRFNLGSV